MRRARAFAVVAQEVRELAQRSANAAKDIQDAHHQVWRGSGRRVSVSCRKPANRWVKSKRRSSASTTISTRSPPASNEQATGLHEVNTAVNRWIRSRREECGDGEEKLCWPPISFRRKTATLFSLLSHFKIGDTQAAGASMPVSRASQPVQQAAVRAPSGPRAAGANSAPRLPPARRMVGNLAARFSGPTAAVAVSPSGENGKNSDPALPYGKVI